LKRSIRLKLIIISISISVAVSIAISVAFCLFYSTYLYDLLSQKTEIVCNRLSLSLGNQVWDISSPDCSLIIESELKDEDILAIVLQSDYVSIALGRDTSAVNGERRIKSLDREESLSLGRIAFMTRRANLIHDSKIIGKVTVFSTDAGVKSSIFSRMLMIPLSSAFIGVFIAFALFIAVDRLISVRLIELTRVVNVYAEGDFSSRAGIRYTDEISVLGKSFNQMAEKLELLYRDLHYSEAHYRELYDGVPTGLFRTTIDGHFVDTNPPMVALLGFEDRAELVTSTLQDMYVDKSDYELWKSTMDSESSLQNMEFRLRRRDGSLCWVRNRTHMIKDREGRTIGYEGCLEDITVIKSAEAEQKKLIAELESKNAELARFTYSVSHDLKSPLITIKGFLCYLEKEAKEGNFDDFEKDLARITNAVDRMESLLLELLELSRIGRIENEKVVLSFEEVAREAVSLVEGRLQERNVEVEIAHDLPSVFGDASRLREVVVNLVDNAVKFMGDQGNPRVQIDARTDNGETVFFVRDNGIGIDPRYHRRVFGLFERLNPNTEGTGMGLTIAERIINVHGGRIWVESEGIGKGSSFCFTLPCSPVANDEYGVK